MPPVPITLLKAHPKPTNSLVTIGKAKVAFMDLHSVLKKLIRLEQGLIGQEVIAFAIDQKKIRAKTGNLVGEYRLLEPFCGWGIFQITSDGGAQPIREATAWERDQHLRRLAKLSLTLIFRDVSDSWWGWNRKLNSLVPVHLVEGYRTFDVITAATDGCNYWFLHPDPNSDMRKAELMRECLEDEIRPDELFIHSLKPRHKSAYTIAWEIRTTRKNKDTSLVRQRLEKVLSIAGAELQDYTSNIDGFVVWWKKGGRTITTTLSKNLEVISAGFCISGGDWQHDLASLASLIDKPGARGNEEYFITHSLEAHRYNSPEEEAYYERLVR